VEIYGALATVRSSLARVAVSAYRKLEMSTVTIVVVGIWNSTLLAGLGAVIYWRARVFHWLTQLDGEQRELRENADSDRWKAFLAEHPELIDS